MTAAKILVCGGRTYINRERVFAVLDSLVHHLEHNGGSVSDLVIIHGAAKGADALAGEWAKSRGAGIEEYKAEWKKFGASAGPRRNQQMLKEGKPNLVLAFAGGKGTQHMMSEAKKNNIRVVEIKE